MWFTMGKKQVKVEYQVVLLGLICLGWSIYYYWSTANTPDGGEDSVLFIKPLVIILMLSIPFVIKSAIKVDQQVAEVKKNSDKGIFHVKRLVFVFSIFLYAFLLPHLGYLIPSIAYLLIMCFYLGLRNYYIFAGVLAGYAFLLWVCFKELMGVPIPVFPGL